METLRGILIQIATAIVLFLIFIRFEDQIRNLAEGLVGKKAESKNAQSFQTTFGSCKLNDIAFDEHLDVSFYSNRPSCEVAYLQEFANVLYGEGLEVNGLLDDPTFSLIVEIEESSDVLDLESSTLRDYIELA